MAIDLDEQHEKINIEKSGITRKASEKNEQTKKLEEFCLRNKDRILQWRKDNGNHKPPIYWSDKLNDFWWANRDQRRKMVALERKTNLRPNLVLPKHLEGEDGLKDGDGDNGGEPRLPEKSGGENTA